MTTSIIILTIVIVAALLWFTRCKHPSWRRDHDEDVYYFHHRLEYAWRCNECNSMHYTDELEAPKKSKQ